MVAEGYSKKEWYQKIQWTYYCINKVKQHKKNCLKLSKCSSSGNQNCLAHMIVKWLVNINLKMFTKKFWFQPQEKWVGFYLF